MERPMTTCPRCEECRAVEDILDPLHHVCARCRKDSLVVELGGGNQAHQHQALRLLPKYVNCDRVKYDDRTIGCQLDSGPHGIQMLPFDDGQVDLIYSSHCLEHIRDIKTLLNECARVLRKGKPAERHYGVMEVVVPHHDSDKAFAIDHVRVFTRETFRSLAYGDIEDYGFRRWEILYLEGEKDDSNNPQLRCRMRPAV